MCNEECWANGKYAEKLNLHSDTEKLHYFLCDIMDCAWTPTNGNMFSWRAAIYTFSFFVNHLNCIQFPFFILFFLKDLNEYSQGVH